MSAQINKCAAQLCVLVACLAFLTEAQGLGPTTPAKEYVRFGGQVVAIENGAAPIAAASASPSNLSFPITAINSPAAPELVYLNSVGTAALSISAAPSISGTDAGDFSIIGDSCFAGQSVAAGSNCSLYVAFSPQFPGTRTATLTFSDNAAAGGTQTVALSGVGAGSAPTGLTTYLGDYGAGLSPYSGPIATLPIRAYYPTGAAQINWVQAYLNAGTATEYTILVEQNGAGGYKMIAYIGTTTSPVQVSGALTASGQTIALPTPVALGSLTISAYRFALVQNEMQVDLTLEHTGTFSDQVVIDANAGTYYSVPWSASDGTWSSGTAANSCNGTSIASSSLAGAGGWQCWTSTQLGTSTLNGSGETYGGLYWNNQSADSYTGNIGWLMLGTGQCGTQSISPGRPERWLTLGCLGEGHRTIFTSRMREPRCRCSCSSPKQRAVRYACWTARVARRRMSWGGI